jgi:hypothetical protein
LVQFSAWMAAPIVAILIHERDPGPERGRHRIWKIAQIWKQWGIDVRPWRGLGAHGHADVVVAHIDLSVVPDDYLRFLDRFPRVVNRRVADISKRRVSSNLVGPEDHYDGPVIVKTNANSGGLPELGHRGRVRKLLARWWRRLAGGPGWSRVEWIDTGRYPIFDSLRHVPRAIFENPNLVVERFLPETYGATYRIRYLHLFGTERYARIHESPTPLVKTSPGVTGSQVPFPPELDRVAENFQLDYGKIDYVMREGGPIVLDVAKTPGSVHPASKRPRRGTELLARGIASWLPGVVPPPRP